MPTNILPLLALAGGAAYLITQKRKKEEEEKKKTEKGCPPLTEINPMQAMQSLAEKYPPDKPLPLDKNAWDISDELFSMFLPIECKSDPNAKLSISLGPGLSTKAYPAPQVYGSIFSDVVLDGMVKRGVLNQPEAEAVMGDFLRWYKELMGIDWVDPVE